MLRTAAIAAALLQGIAALLGIRALARRRRRR